MPDLIGKNKRLKAKIKALKAERDEYKAQRDIAIADADECDADVERMRNGLFSVLWPNVDLEKVSELLLDDDLNNRVDAAMAVAQK